MEPKKRKRRTKYTLMIFSDSMEEGVKQIYLGSRRLTVLKMLFTVVLIADICYLVYNTIILSGVRERNGSQAVQIKQLEEDKETLEAQNAELTEKVAILSETINQKAQGEEAAATELAQLSIPRGFPLTGSASIQEEAQGQENGEEGEVQDEQQNDKETEPILVFKGTSGNMVVAAATGTVESVEPDAKYGNKIIIDHGNGYRSIYRNKGEARVKNGDEVVRGFTLFIIGEDNLELGYQIMEGENYINPEDIVEING